MDDFGMQSCKHHQMHSQTFSFDSRDFSRCGCERPKCHRKRRHCHHRTSAVKAMVECTCGNCIQVQTTSSSMRGRCDRCRRHHEHHRKHHRCCSTSW